MNNDKFSQDERSPKQKALEILPVIVSGIFLLLGMYFNNFTLKVVFCVIAAVICVGAYLVVLVREIINRRKKRKGEK